MRFQRPNLTRLSAERYVYANCHKRVRLLLICRYFDDPSNEGQVYSFKPKRVSWQERKINFQRVHMF